MAAASFWKAKNESRSALFRSEGVVGFGAVVRDGLGGLKAVFPGWWRGVVEPLTAELLVMLEGLPFGRKMGLTIDVLE